MGKYIDSEKLIAEIKRLKDKYPSWQLKLAMDDLCDFITTLQQEQPEANEVEKGWSLQIQAYLTTASDELYAPGKPLYTEEHHEGIHECMKMWQKLHHYYFSTKQEQPGLPGIEESGVPGKDYIPVEWVDACEKYGKWKIVKQEQPEGDLEKEIDAVWNPRFNLGWDEHSALSMNHAGFASIARHFWNKGYNARKP